MITAPDGNRFPINDFDGWFHISIKREHLRARDFSKAKLIFQTT
jgi:hypothetical protein